MSKEIEELKLKLKEKEKLEQQAELLKEEL
jgi:hypothetical protein